MSNSGFHDNIESLEKGHYVVLHSQTNKQCQLSSKWFGDFSGHTVALCPEYVLAWLYLYIGFLKHNGNVQYIIVCCDAEIITT